MSENPQAEAGYTKISNELLEAIMQHKFSGLKLSVVLAIIRLTFGYQKTKCDLSITYLAKMVDGSYSKVAGAVRGLIKDSVLTECSPPNHTKKRVIGINQKRNEWSVPNWLLCPKRTTLSQTDERGLSKTGHSIKDKENVSKENIICTDIFDHWNSQKIIKHGKMTKAMKSKIRTVLKEYKPDVVKAAITNYGTVINSTEHWFDHPWPIRHFLARGLERFLDEADPLNTFRKDGYNGQYGRNISSSGNGGSASTGARSGKVEFEFDQTPYRKSDV